MDLLDIENNAEDQDRGRWFSLFDPVNGSPTGIRLRIAGPDSMTQARARLRLTDEMAEAADGEGRVRSEARENARLNNLARCVLGWEVTVDGAALPFNQANVLRLLRSAFWVQVQVDGFATDRRTFMAPMNTGD